LLRILIKMRKPLPLLFRENLNIGIVWEMAFYTFWKSPVRECWQRNHSQRVQPIPLTKHRTLSNLDVTQSKWRSVKIFRKKLGKCTESKRLELLFSGDGRNNSTHIRQDAEFYFGQLNLNSGIPLAINLKFSHSWIQVISGCLRVYDKELKKADGLAIENQKEQLLLKATEPTEFFLFQLAA